MLTAGQWFTIAGVLMALFGLGLLMLTLWPQPKQAPRPVRTIERIRLHELSLDTRPGPYGPHGAAGFTVVSDRWAAPPRTRPTARPDATRLDLRRGPGGVRP